MNLDLSINYKFKLTDSLGQLEIILASSSPSRLKLLKNIGFEPDQVIASDIDETPLKKELPAQLAKRLALAKAEHIASNISDGVIIAADTVSSVGRRIISKALSDGDVKEFLELLSGRRHNVHTGLCVIHKRSNIIKKQNVKLVKSIAKFKRLTAQEIHFYVRSKEGIGKGGGHSIQGLSQNFIQWISGSYSNIAGLPLHELYQIFIGFGLFNPAKAEFADN